MTHPNTYREVELPETWDEWPVDAKVNYLSSAMGRDALLSSVGELADIPDDEIGVQSIHKSGLAQLVVVLSDEPDASASASGPGTSVGTVSEPGEYPGTPEPTDETVVEVTFSSLERGTLTRYLRPGESIDLPADRVEVQCFDDSTDADADAAE